MNEVPVPVPPEVVDLVVEPIGTTGLPGPPGTAIRGTVATVTDLPDPASAERGDAWIVAADGHLYGLVAGVWIDVGRIVGTDGEPGQDGQDGADGEDGEGVPPGGSIGQWLAKTGSADFATGWADAPTGTPTGGNQYEVLTKSSAADGDTAWAAPGDRGSGATAVGAGTTVASNGVAVGPSANGQNGSVAVGDRSVTNAAGGAVSVGQQANSGRYSVALGAAAQATGQQATGIGQATRANFNNATALGAGAVAGHTGAVAIGRSTAGAAATSTAVDQIMLGTAAHTVTTPGTVDFRTFSPEMIDALKDRLGLT